MKLRRIIDVNGVCVVDNRLIHNCELYDKLIVCFITATHQPKYYWIEQPLGIIQRVKEQEIINHLNNCIHFY